MVSAGKGYDLVIAGAGPAGLTLAWKVAERGHSVLVTDIKRNASDVRYLTLGSFIDLERWELPAKIAQRIENAYYISTNERVKRHNRNPSVCTLSLDRRKLLVELERKAKKAGAKILYKSHVNKVVTRKTHIQEIILKTQFQSIPVSATFYADCSGEGRVFEHKLPILSPSRVRHSVGIEYVVPLLRGPHSFHFFVGKSCPRGYGWLFPINNNEAILGYGTFAKMSAAELTSRLDNLLKLLQEERRIGPEVKLKNSGEFRTGFPLRRFHCGNVVYVGDVALQGCPVLGEGVRFVMDSASMAATAVDKALRTGDIKHLSEYSTAWVSKYYIRFRAGYVAQRLADRLLQSEWVADNFVKYIGKISEENLLRIMQGDLNSRFILRIFLTGVREWFSPSP